jgi:hypothetical protein
MNPSAKPAESQSRAQDREPAKGGTKAPHETAYPSGDTPKPQPCRKHASATQHAI